MIHSDQDQRIFNSTERNDTMAIHPRVTVTGECVQNTQEIALRYMIHFINLYNSQRNLGWIRSPVLFESIMAMI